HCQNTHGHESDRRISMFDPIGSFYRIRELYLSYLDTAFRIADADVAERRRLLLTTPGTLCTEPLIEPIPRYRSGDLRVEDLVSRAHGREVLEDFDEKERKAFAQLAVAGLLASEQVEANPLSRRSRFELYSHQRDMLARGVQAGRPGIVTSGTGSGK